jgi:hypothetical protein
MSNTFSKSIAIAATTVLSLVASSFAQSAQAATFNFSYKDGAVSEQLTSSSFSYTDDSTGSIVNRGNLTPFGLSYNGGVRQNKVAIERFFNRRDSRYYLSNITALGSTARQGSFYKISKAKTAKVTLSPAGAAVNISNAIVKNIGSFTNAIIPANSAGNSCGATR